MRGIFLAAALLFTSQAQALDFKPSPAVAEIFDKAHVKGTFVLYDVSANTFTGLDQKRAETRFIPASTFKIPNSLIGLSTGAVSSVDEVLPYGGKPQFMKSWEKDMGLREAIKISNVPIYKELARRIGLERMKANISKLGYGNAEIGSVVDNFWLVGPLKISAVEQTQFLARLAQGQLPVPADAPAKVRDIAQLDKGEGWTLYGKTGWSDMYKPDLGWWVGWVEQSGKVYSFALNIDMPDTAIDGPKRVEIGKASLKALGLM
jgi:beta-lactamase class D OXA-50